MIGYLKGNLHRKDDQKAVIDVNGVGYDVFLTKDALITLGDPGTPMTLEIYSHINESTFQLYGFKTIQEKKFFQKLISVSGVGPKLGLQMISAMPLNELMLALTQGNLVKLTSISGVGKKTAGRMIVELKDKFKDEGLTASSPAANDDTKTDARISDVTSALVSLGYQESLAKKIVNSLVVTQEDTIQSLIKKSLMNMQG